MTWSINNALRPLRTGDLGPGKGLTEGGSTSAPVYLGTKDLAANTNELAAHLGNPLVLQVKSDSLEGITFDGASVTEVRFATYIVQPPAVRASDDISNGLPTTLLIQVYGQTTTNQWRVRGVSALGNGTWGSYAANTGGTSTAYVDISSGINTVSTTSDGSADAYRYLHIEVQVDTVGSETFGPEMVAVFPAFSSEDYASDAVAFQTGAIMPQDSEAWDEDSPCNVQSLRELMVANNWMYFHTHRHIINVCHWYDQSTSTSLKRGLFSSSGERQPLMQFVYWPRAGVKNLAISFNAFVDSYGGGSDDATIAFMWENGDGAVETTVQAASLSWTSWTAVGTWLPVPQNAPGPRILSIYGQCEATGTNEVYVQGISIIEVVERPLDGIYLGA